MSGGLVFPLLRPGDLPYNGLGADPGGPVARALAEVTGVAADAPDHHVLSAVRSALSDLPLSPERAAAVTDDPEESSGNRANDRAFGVVRVAGDPAWVFTRSCLSGYVALLEEAESAGTSLAAREWACLRTAFDGLFAYLAEAPLPEPVDECRPYWNADVSHRKDALRRWTRGHHAFLVLIQGLLVALERFRVAAASQVAQAGVALELAVRLLSGAQATLRFIGDFPYEEYVKQVRPTLMPPVAPPDSSGLRWRDHEALVRQLDALRPVFGSLDSRLEPGRHALHDALAAIYDAHKYVCATFVGEERPSVLTASKSHDLPAVAMLEHFKRVRLRMITGPR